MMQNAVIVASFVYEAANRERDAAAQAAAEGPAADDVAELIGLTGLRRAEIDVPDLAVRA